MSGSGRAAWWPFAVPAIIAIALVTLTFVFSDAGPEHAALSCPAFLHTGTSGPSVPAVPQAVDTEGRLAPDRLPTHVVLCLYGQTKDRLPVRKPFTGSKRLGGDFNGLVDTVAYLPRKIASQAHCSPRLADEDAAYYLLGLSYVDGAEWISAGERFCSPTPTTNGSYVSSALLSVELRDAYQSGAWPTADDQQPCATTSLGRTGQEIALVPADPTSVDVCTTTGGAVVAYKELADAAAQQLVAALNHLSTSPMTRIGGCFGRYSAGQGHGYRLVFHYPVGADAVIFVSASKECEPPIGNGSLQSNDVTAAVQMLTDVVG